MQVITSGADSCLTPLRCLPRPTRPPRPASRSRDEPAWPWRRCSWPPRSRPARPRGAVQPGSTTRAVTATTASTSGSADGHDVPWGILIAAAAALLALGLISLAVAGGLGRRPSPAARPRPPVRPAEPPVTVAAAVTLPPGADPVSIAGRPRAAGLARAAGRDPARPGARRLRDPLARGPGPLLLHRRPGRRARFAAGALADVPACGASTRRRAARRSWTPTPRCSRRSGARAGPSPTSRSPGAGSSGGSPGPPPETRRARATSRPGPGGSNGLARGARRLPGCRCASRRRAPSYCHPPLVSGKRTTSFPW